MNAHFRLLWPHLPALLSVARRGSYSAAADELRIDRSTVSRHVAAAEQILQRRLFDRANGVPRLTRAGRQMIAGLEGAEELVRAAIAGDDNDETETAGTVRVTVAPNLASVIAPGVLELLKAEPLLNLHISASYDIEDIAGHDVDIAMRIMRADPDPALVSTCLGEIRGAIYQSSSADDATEKVRVSIHRPGDNNRPSYLSDESSEHTPRLVVAGIDAHAAFVRAGGRGRMPHFMAQKDSRLERASETLPFEGWRLWVVSTESRFALKRVKRTFDCLAEIGSSIIDTTI